MHVDISFPAAGAYSEHWELSVEVAKVDVAVLRLHLFFH
jgi:hypothetical protein